ncbi:MAG: hypothetical protein RR298_07525 [Alistipes sp.]
MRCLWLFTNYFLPHYLFHPKIKEYADLHGWHIHRIERTITASKVSRRRQEEWITTNY